MLLPPNSWLFYVANFFFMVSFFVSNILILRVALTLGNICFALWGLVILNISLDTFLWNAIFAIINFTHVVILVSRMRPIKFHPEIEKVYKDVFVKNHSLLSRADFRDLINLSGKHHSNSRWSRFVRYINCFRSRPDNDGTSVYTLEQGLYYAKKGDVMDKLSILISGQLGVFATSTSEDGEDVLLNITHAGEFIESPEWATRIKHPYFEVSICALTDCRVISWDRAKLEKFLRTNALLNTALTGAINVDLGNKVLTEGKTAVKMKRVKLSVAESVKQFDLSLVPQVV